MSDMYLDQARTHLNANLKNGTVCLCCGQFAKMYKRKLNSGMAKVLITIFKLSNQEWFHVNQSRIAIAGDWSYLQFWGLIERRVASKEEKEHKKNSGYWRITDKGVQFLKSEISLKSHINLYDNKEHGFEGKDVYIADCLGKHFNYQELMNA